MLAGVDHDCFERGSRGTRLDQVVQHHDRISGKFSQPVPSYIFHNNRLVELHLNNYTYSTQMLNIRPFLCGIDTR